MRGQGWFAVRYASPGAQRGGVVEFENRRSFTLPCPPGGAVSSRDCVWCCCSKFCTTAVGKGRIDMALKRGTMSNTPAAPTLTRCSGKCRPFVFIVPVHLPGIMIWSYIYHCVCECVVVVIVGGCLWLCVCLCVCAYVCLCVCVRERKREREREFAPVWSIS